jgi:serine/threonine protein kinase
LEYVKDPESGDVKYAKFSKIGDVEAGEELRRTADVINELVADRTPHASPAPSFIVMDGRTAIITPSLGEDLYSLSGSLSYKMKKDVIYQVCEYLDAIHERKMVHGDIKSENIVVSLDAKGSVKVTVIDEGQMFLEGGKTDVISQTLRSLPPEAVLGKAQTKNTDRWALGCTIFEMLTGKSFVLSERVGNAGFIEVMGSVLDTYQAYFGKIPQEMLRSFPEDLVKIFYDELDGEYVLKKEHNTSKDCVFEEDLLDGAAEGLFPEEDAEKWDKILHDLFTSDKPLEAIMRSIYS